MWYKQQKYLMKYGTSPYGTMSPYGGGPYGGGWFGNGEKSNGLDMPEENAEDDDNLLHLIHPLGEDIKQKPKIEEPKIIKDEGHEYAVLDWGAELKKPGVEKYYGDDPDKVDDEKPLALPKKVRWEIQE